MRKSAFDETERSEIGARIKRLRKEAGLRQWQVAEILGATQPAIHMYERGVLPEARRLLELAKIGRTTVEWILTGHHWENGSPDMPRVPREVYDLAFKLCEYGEEEREALGSALEVVNAAVEAIQRAEQVDTEQVSAEKIAQRIKDFIQETRRALATALEVHDAYREALLDQGKEVVVQAADRAEKGKGRRAVSFRSSTLEPVRGHIYRLDSSLLAISDILMDKELRNEFEESLTKLRDKLEDRRKRTTRARKRGAPR